MSWDAKHDEWYDLRTENNGLYGNEAKVAKVSETVVSASVTGVNATADLLYMAFGGLSLKFGIAGISSVGLKNSCSGTLNANHAAGNAVDATENRIAATKNHLWQISNRLDALTNYIHGLNTNNQGLENNN